MKLKASILLSGIMLTACTTNTATDFSCPIEKGLGCASMTEADNHVRGHQNSQNEPNNYSTVLNAIIKGDPQRQTSKARAWTGPERSFEAVYRVWFPSFVDKNGNYHDESAIYISIPTNTWIEESEGE